MLTKPKWSDRRVSLRLSRGEYQRLEWDAKEQGITVAQLVRNHCGFSERNRGRPKKEKTCGLSL